MRLSAYADMRLWPYADMRICRYAPKGLLRMSRNSNNNENHYSTVFRSEKGTIMRITLIENESQ